MANLSFEDALIEFLKSRGISIAGDAFVRELRQSGGLILLDGIDEVMKAMPGIVPDIIRFSAEYPKVQMVVSSRLSSEGTERLPFLAITLLPFTDQQRSRFVEKWLGAEHSDLSVTVLQHLDTHPPLSEIVRNPLHATMLCVLAESNVPLPSTEVRLYDERMSLLLGYYDIHKQVRRVSTHSHHLRSLAQKLAFRLHKEAKLFEERAHLYEWAEEILAEEVSSAECRIAIDELIDPCNVLIPMTEDGKLGFGHLRFQEYLAAKELASNRGVEVVLLLHQNWWNGALMLFAQMSGSIGWLIKALRNLKELDAVRDKIEAMIEVGPRRQRSGLRAILLDSIKFDQETFR